MLSFQVVLGLLFAVTNAFAFTEPFDMSQYGEALYGSDRPYERHCRYKFAWGRNSVRVKYDDENEAIECTFTHSSRVQNPPESSSVIHAIFYQHYTCSDNTRAVYSTNWVGTGFRFWHYTGAEDSRVFCD